MKKRGFTLVELLAVILILGIIALIAIPTVNKVVKQAREGVVISSVTGYIKGVENYTLAGALSNNILVNGTYEVSYLKTLGIDVKGSIPTQGWITVENNEVSDAKVCINKFFVQYDGENTKVISSCNDDIKYTEGILHGADPVISENLVPVLISDTGVVTKADTKSIWYNYSKKEWANAIILNGDDTYTVGATIPESAIQSYFVWIPRYKYKLFNLGKYYYWNFVKPTEICAQTIEIVFEDKETDISNGDEVGEYLTHPAFKTFNTNGIWVGKFETTGSIDSLSVKPGLQSVREQTVGVMFTAAYNYNRNIDSHMMKNTEWGAVAYLSHSDYGINKKINTNNNSSFMTGYSSVGGTTQAFPLGTYGTTNDVTLPYNTSLGYMASTTGNITGAYDMAGGAREYMASYNGGTFGSSGFTPTNYDLKYFDVYRNSSSDGYYSYRILGDATGELGPFHYYNEIDGNYRINSGWYYNSGSFVNNTYVWFVRGGGYTDGILAGQFSFFGWKGDSNISYGFRVVLAN